MEKSSPLLNKVLYFKQFRKLLHLITEILAVFHAVDIFRASQSLHFESSFFVGILFYHEDFRVPLASDFAMFADIHDSLFFVHDINSSIKYGFTSCHSFYPTFSEHYLQSYTRKFFWCFFERFLVYFLIGTSYDHNFCNFMKSYS